MKKIVIISNEETAQDPGYVRHPEQYGLAEGICNIPNLAGVIEGLGGYEVSVLHHTRVRQAEESGADCVVLSGRFSDKALPYEDMLEEFREEIHWLRETRMPVLGICMGLQLLCAAHGVGIKRLEREEGEFGFMPIRLRDGWPMPEGSGEYIRCLAMHRCQVERVPEEFVGLAGSELCDVQMIAHKSRPMVGVQFHPEFYTAAYPDGNILLWQLLARLTDGGNRKGFSPWQKA